MTGGAKGRCNPAATGTFPAFASGYGHGRALGLRRGFRGGFGPGQGRGYGRGYGWYPPVAGAVYPVEVVNEMGMLKAQADYMKKSLDSIGKRAAGMRAVVLAISKEVDMVLTGYCSPTAMKYLSDNGIDVATGIKGTITEAVVQYSKQIHSTPIRSKDEPDIAGPL